MLFYKQIINHIMYYSKFRQETSTTILIQYLFIQFLTCFYRLFCILFFVRKCQNRIYFTSTNTNTKCKSTKNCYLWKIWCASKYLYIYYKYEFINKKFVWDPGAITYLDYVQNHLYIQIQSERYNEIRYKNVDRLIILLLVVIQIGI